MNYGGIIVEIRKCTVCGEVLGIKVADPEKVDYDEGESV